MPTVNRAVWVVFLASSVAFTACGGDSGTDHNQEILDSAQSASSTEDAILQALDAELNLGAYAGVENTFSPEGGVCEAATIDPSGEVEEKPCCQVETVYLGEEVGTVSELDSVVIAPDDSYAVDVGQFQGTDPAICLETVIGAVEG